MKGVSLIILLVLIFALVIGCEEETTGVDETGIRLSFLAYDTTVQTRIEGDQTVQDTIIKGLEPLSFGVLVFLDDSYQTRISSTEPYFFSLAPGSYELYAESNCAYDEDSLYYCWDKSFAVEDGNVTNVILNATYPQCSESSVSR